jgi:hypothetical protein
VRRLAAAASPTPETIRLAPIQALSGHRFSDRKSSYEGLVYKHYFTNVAAKRFDTAPIPDET